MAHPLELLIFDLDGVITSEQKYWNAARLTVWELLCSPDYLGATDYFGGGDRVETRLATVGDHVISEAFIYQLKRRAVNSNWDLTFFVVCLQLIAILKHRPEAIARLEGRSATADLQAIASDVSGLSADASRVIVAEFWAVTLELRGAAVLDRVGEFARQQLGRSLSLFDPRGDLWQLCYDNFQAWYEGKNSYELPGDETVLPPEAIAATLVKLQQKYVLGVATGRPKTEAIAPLRDLALLPYFDPQRIVTYDDVLAAEQQSGAAKLGKPHPFVLHRAARPDLALDTICADEFGLENAAAIAYIGDAGSDVVAARRAGCLSIGVLTGFAIADAAAQKRALLSDLGCEVILDSILDLPSWLESGS